MVKQGLWLAVVLGACGGSDARFDAPNIEEAVDQSLPAGLGGKTRAARPAGDDSTPAGAIQKFFTDTVSTLSPTDPAMQGSAIGELKADVRNIDVRMLGAEETSAGSPCLDAAPAAHPIDLSSVSPALSLTLNIQCRSAFGGGAATGGLIFGLQGTTYSIWESLEGTDKRGYIANVTADEMGAHSYDFMRLEDSSSLNRITAYHAKGDVDNDTFELSYASADPSTRLWCGFQIVADGTHVYAKGKHLPQTSGTDCATATAFSLCFDAATFAETDVANCSGLTSAFTLAAFTQADVAGAAAKIDAALALSSADGHVTDE